MKHLRIGNLNETVGAIESKCGAGNTEARCGCSALECAVVGSNNGQRVAISWPPVNKTIWSGQTTRCVSLKNLEHGPSQQKKATAPFATDSHTTVYMLI